LQEEKKGGKLERKERLRKRGDFKKLFQKGKRFHGGQYSILVVSNNLCYNRFAVAVKKRVGKACIRNYEKRIVREFFRKHKDKLLMGMDILIIIRNKTSDFNQSMTILERLFKNIYLLFLSPEC